MEGLGLGIGLVANRFDVVTVRSDDKRRVVVGMVVRPKARRTIVFASDEERGSVERFNFGPVARGESQVHRAWRGPGRRKEEARLTVRAKASAMRSLSEENNAQRREGRGKEAAAGAEIRDAEVDVIQHERPRVSTDER